MMPNATHTCLDCGAPIVSRMIRCFVCKTKSITARLKEHPSTRPIPVLNSLSRDSLITAAKLPKLGNPFWGTGSCKACGGQVEGLRQYCRPCKILRHRAEAAEWYEKNREYKITYECKRAKDFPEKSRAKVRRWAASPKGAAYIKAYSKTYVRPSRGIIRVAQPLLAYPFVRTARDEHADLLFVNSLVPQGMPGREDVVQDALLAVLEGRTTLDQLKAGGISMFLRNFRRSNYESNGYALSLDMPRIGGGSWHDVLPDDKTM